MSTDAARLDGGEASPLVSVITVCRDSEATIRRTIESVLAQDYQPIEYIVVDGASSDGTVDIVRECALRSGGRMRWVSEPDAGIYDAMNEGVRLARGEYVAFVNSDDWYLEGGVSSLVAAATAGAGSDIAYAGMVHALVAGGDERVEPAGRVSLDPMMRTMPACHEAMLFRRDLHERFGEYSLEYPVAADYEFLLRCVSGGATTVRVDAPVVHYLHGGLSDLDPPAVERDYAAVRVKYGADPACERFRVGRSIFNGRAYRLLARVPVAGRWASSAYERWKTRAR